MWHIPVMKNGRRHPFNLEEHGIGRVLRAEGLCLRIVHAQMKRSDSSSARQYFFLLSRRPFHFFDRSILSKRCGDKVKRHHFDEAPRVSSAEGLLVLLRAPYFSRVRQKGATFLSHFSLHPKQHILISEIYAIWVSLERALNKLSDHIIYFQIRGL